MKSDLIDYAYSSVSADDGGTAAKEATIALLRSFADDPKATAEFAEIHPLGFLCFRWSMEGGKTLRLHLWSKQFNWRQSPDWQIHDHIFSFDSVVVSGTLLNKRYEATASSSVVGRRWPIYEVKYSGGKSALQHSGTLASIRITSAETVSESQRYTVRERILHRTKLVSAKAISLVAAVHASSPASAARVIGAATKTDMYFSRSTEEIDMASIALEFLKVADNSEEA